MKTVNAYGNHSYLIIDMVRSGKINLLRRVNSVYLKDPLIVAEAAYCGRLDIIRLLLSKKCAVDYWICHHAIRSGKLEVIIYLKRTGIWDKYYKETLTNEDFNIHYDSEDD